MADVLSMLSLRRLITPLWLGASLACSCVQHANLLLSGQALTSDVMFRGGVLIYTRPPLFISVTQLCQLRVTAQSALITGDEENAACTK